MRIPLTKYGLPQAAVYPSLLFVFMLVLWFGAHYSTPPWVVYCVEIVIGVIFIWVLSFFRDPQRNIPDDPRLLLAPADGAVVDVEAIDEPVFIKGKALKIGIFLSIFDVHINRSPCRARVEKITYRPGNYLDARNPDAARLNESNDLWLTRLDSPCDKLIVRQISGAIARRIVCDVSPAEELPAGRQFGMIKFGSRTELYVPLRDDVQCLVKTGDKVKAGLTPMLKYI